MTIKDRSIFYPGGPAGVLLVHGLGGTPLEMKSLARALSAQGATVLCCQLAGHCGTEEELIASRWQDWYASAEAGLMQLATHCDRIVVGGLSMGAVIAARLAARCPKQVDGLMMLAPTLVYDGWSVPWYRFLLKLLISTPIGQRYRFEEREPFGVKDKRIRKFIQTQLMSGDSGTAGSSATPSQSLRELWRIVDALKGDWGKIRQHTLLVHARDDDIASLSNAFFVQKHLGGLVDTLVLDDSYHLVTLDRQRSLVLERAGDFVEMIATRQPATRASRQAA